MISDVGGSTIPKGHFLQLREEAAHAQPTDEGPLLRDAHAPELEVQLPQPVVSILNTCLCCCYVQST